MMLYRGTQKIHYIGLGQTLSARQDTHVYGAATLVSDTFTDSDGTQIINHAPDVDVVGGGWGANNPSTNTIQSNKLHSGGTGETDASIGVGQTTMDVRADITIASDGSGVMVRFVDTNNLIWCLPHIPTATLYVHRRQGGAYYQIGSAAITISAGVPVALKHTVESNDQHNSYVDGTLKVTVTETAFNTATSAGIRSNQGTNQADNFEVYSI